VRHREEKRMNEKLQTGKSCEELSEKERDEVDGDKG
jgi:hypothetical protein